MVFHLYFSCRFFMKAWTTILKWLTAWGIFSQPQGLISGDKRKLNNLILKGMVHFQEGNWSYFIIGLNAHQLSFMHLVTRAGIRIVYYDFVCSHAERMVSLWPALEKKKQTQKKQRQHIQPQNVTNYRVWTIHSHFHRSRQFDIKQNWSLFKDGAKLAISQKQLSNE